METRRQTIAARLAAARKAPAVAHLNAFFEGPVYPAFYAAVVLLTSLTGIEIFFFIFTTLIIVYTTLFCEDTKPLLTPVVMLVYAISWQHTFQPPYNSQFLSSPLSLATIGACGGILAAVFMFRLIVFPPVRNFFKSRTYLGGGLILFAAALVVNGLFYFNGKSVQDALLGLLLAFSFLFLFIYFYNTLRIGKDGALYFAYLFALVTAVILIQIAKVYLFDGVLREDGSINKDAVIMGWGSPNKVGVMLAMYLPAGFYLAYKCRHGWLWYLFAFVQTGGICLTLCRSAMLVGAAVTVAAAVVLSVVKSPQRTVIRAVNLAAVLAGIVLAVLFFDRIREMFSLLFERGFSDSGRFFIWKNGLQNFLREPLFGVGFYAPIVFDDPSWTYGFENWFLPDMYHNLFIQTIACCGLIGMLALVYHLAQVLSALTCRPTPERFFYFGTVVMILGTAMFENHIFHILPALLYSVVLLLWEKDMESEAPLCSRRGKNGLFVFGK